MRNLIQIGQKNVWVKKNFGGFLAELLAFEVFRFSAIFVVFRFFQYPLGGPPLPQPSPKIKNIQQYLSFAILGTFLQWKMTELFTFEVAVRNVTDGRTNGRTMRNLIQINYSQFRIGWPCWGRTKSKLNINGGRIKFVNNFSLSKYNVISIVKSNKYLGNLPVTQYRDAGFVRTKISLPYLTNLNRY